MSEIKELSIEELEKISGGVSQETLDYLRNRIASSTELDYLFLCQLYVLSIAPGSFYASLTVVIKTRLEILGYEIRVKGVFKGEMLVFAFEELPE